MEILIKNRVKGSGLRPSKVIRVAQRVLETLGYKEAQVSILLCEDSYIQKLNKEYRRVDAPTDVLAFSMHEGPFPRVHPEILGDVVISLEAASRQAKRFCHSLNKEVALLVIHGILHLLGYDHQKKKDREKMRRKEKEILEVIRKEEL